MAQTRHTPGNEELKNVEGLQYLEDTFMTSVEHACGIGYGRMMQLISNKWASLDPVGALTVGPAIGLPDPGGTIIQAQIDRLKAEKAELVEACKAIESCWGLTDGLCEQIRAAIASATK